MFFETHLILDRDEKLASFDVDTTGEGARVLPDNIIS